MVVRLLPFVMTRPNRKSDLISSHTYHHRQTQQSVDLIITSNKSHAHPHGRATKKKGKRPKNSLPLCFVLFFCFWVEILEFFGTGRHTQETTTQQQQQHTLFLFPCSIVILLHHIITQHRHLSTIIHLPAAITCLLPLFLSGRGLNPTCAAPNRAPLLCAPEGTPRDHHRCPSRAHGVWG